MNTPELDRIRAVQEQSQTIGEFLDWMLNERGLWIAEMRELLTIDRLYPFTGSITSLLAEYFGIDEYRAEQERHALLEELSKSRA